MGSQSLCQQQVFNLERIKFERCARFPSGNTKQYCALCVSECVCVWELGQTKALCTLGLLEKGQPGDGGARL